MLRIEWFDQFQLDQYLLWCPKVYQEGRCDYVQLLTPNPYEGYPKRGFIEVKDVKPLAIPSGRGYVRPTKGGSIKYIDRNDCRHYKTTGSIVYTGRWKFQNETSLSNLGLHSDCVWHHKDYGSKFDFRGRIVMLPGDRYELGPWALDDNTAYIYCINHSIEFGYFCKSNPLQSCAISEIQGLFIAERIHSPSKPQYVGGHLMSNSGINYTLIAYSDTYGWRRFRINYESSHMVSDEVLDEEFLTKVLRYQLNRLDSEYHFSKPNFDSWPNWSDRHYYGFNGDPDDDGARTIVQHCANLALSMKNKIGDTVHGNGHELFKADHYLSYENYMTHKGQLSANCINDLKLTFSGNGEAYMFDLVNSGSDVIKYGKDFIALRKGDITKVASLFLGFIYGIRLMFLDTKELITSTNQELSDRTVFDLKEFRKGYSQSYANHMKMKALGKNDSFAQDWAIPIIEFVHYTSNLMSNSIKEEILPDVFGKHRMNISYEPFQHRVELMKSGADLYNQIISEMHKYIVNYDLALTPDNIWDLVPLSFVVDWIVPIGTWLETFAIEYHLNQRCKVDCVCRSSWLYCQGFQAKRRIMSFLSDDMSDEFTINATITLYERYFHNNVPTPDYSRISNPLSLLSHWKEGTALYVANSKLLKEIISKLRK